MTLLIALLFLTLTSALALTRLTSAIARAGSSKSAKRLLK
jgi:hypothetical protein